MKTRKALLLSAVLCCSLGASAYETPTMGWSSWNTYRVNISGELIKKQAKAMADQGLKEKGYKYINIDDGYFGGRDKNGQLLIHKKRFPEGLKPVADYIHSLGFKAGIYSDGGRNTCGNYWDKDEMGQGVGMYGHDQQDADYFFKELGFDFIKVDFCGGDPGQNTEHLDLNEKERYTAIYNAIQNTGRKDVRINVCRWNFPGTWVHDVSTSWRISPDISANWNSVKGIVNKNLYLSAYATEGKFNDMDMLEVGRGMSDEEDKTHFGMWCIMSSPLLIGCDMTSIKPTPLALLKNEELIALNQDSLALQAQVVEIQNGAYILVKDVETLYGTKRAVAVYNPTDGEVKVQVKMNKLSLAGKVKVRDLFEKADKDPVTTGSMAVTVPAHGTRIYKLEAEERLEQSVYEAENAWLEKYSAIDPGDFARVQQNGKFSGGAKVSYLGDGSPIKDNYMEWRHVYSKNGGYYTLSIAYLSGENRSLTCTINGTDTLQLENMNSGGWDKVGMKTIFVKLQPGDNVIRFSNAQGWAPDIDYIQLNKGNEAVEPVRNYQPTELVKEPQGGEKYMIYSAATGAVTGEGNRQGVLYVEGNRVKREVSGANPTTIKIDSLKNPVFLLEGDISTGFKIKTANDQYIQNGNTGDKEVVWTFENGPEYNKKFPEGSWAIHHGKDYWNGNNNNGGPDNAFVMWENGHPFQFYKYTSSVEKPIEIAEVYAQIKDALNAGSGVGYPNETARQALQKSLDEALKTTDDTALLTKALKQYTEDKENIQLPENGATYTLNGAGYYLKDKGNQLAADSKEVGDTYGALWNCVVKDGKYQFQNAETGSWLGLATVQHAAENFEVSAAQRVAFGNLPVKKTGADFLAVKKDGKGVQTSDKAQTTEELTTDFGWSAIASAQISGNYLATGAPYRSLVPAHAVAFTGKIDAEKGAVVITAYKEEVIPTGLPLIFSAEKAGKIYFVPTSKTDTVSVEQDVQMSLTDMARPEGKNVFVFAVKDGRAGFYPLEAGSQIPAQTPYILTEGADTHTCYPIMRSEETGIEEVTTPAGNKADGPIYDLTGKQVNKMVKGIYIQNGQKKMKK